MNEILWSAPPVRVLGLGAGRLHVRATPGAEVLYGLQGWLRSRREVQSWRFDARHGALDIVFEEGSLRGAFRRRLEDQLALLEAPPPHVRPSLETPRSNSRARLRLPREHARKASALALWLAEVPGVRRSVGVDATGSVTIDFDPELTNGARLCAHAAQSDPRSWPEPAPQGEGIQWGALAFDTAVLALCAAEAAPPAALGAAVALTAWPAFRRAVRSLGEGRLSVDWLDVAAVSISVGTGQAATGAFITWLLGVGDVLLGYSADRARAALGRLMHLDATEAWRLEDGRAVLVPVRSLATGDLLVVETGQRVAADGVVLESEAAVDDKALTGESEPRVRSPGDKVLAASVVVQGRLVLSVERTGGDTAAARIVRILQAAGAKPMTLQRDAERTADRLVAPTFLLAGAAGAGWGTLDAATSVLITDFGTGIRLAVPTAALSAMAAAARAGVLVKGAQYLERLARADVVVFDKTGTLTTGEPEIASVEASEGWGELEVLALCAAAERRQSHPVAEALRNHAAQRGAATLEADAGSERYTVGKGLEARVEGRSVYIGSERFLQELGVAGEAGSAAAGRMREAGLSPLLVAVDGVLAAVLGYRDAVRGESASVVRNLQAGGRRKVVLLSGDSRSIVAATARQLGVDEAHGELLPEEKATHVKALQAAGRIVAMVGDGINDAPALALADVGISLHGSTEAAMETADMVLLEGGLERLPGAFAAGERALRVVQRSLAMVVAPNAVAVVLGALGVLTPAVAALVNNGTTVLATLTALAPLLARREGSA